MSRCPAFQTRSACCGTYECSSAAALAAGPIGFLCRVDPLACFFYCFSEGPNFQSTERQDRPLVIHLARWPGRRDRGRARESATEIGRKTKRRAGKRKGSERGERQRSKSDKCPTSIAPCCPFAGTCGTTIRDRETRSRIARNAAFLFFYTKFCMELPLLSTREPAWYDTRYGSGFSRIVRFL